MDTMDRSRLAQANALGSLTGRLDQGDVAHGTPLTEREAGQ